MSASFLAAAAERAATVAVGDVSIPDLLASLTEPSRRMASLDALLAIPSSATVGVALEDVASAVLPCLSDENNDVVHASVGLLCPLGSAVLAPHAAAILVHFEQCSDDVRWRVAEVLGAIHKPVLANHVEDVSRLLEHATDDVRRRAVELLSSFALGLPAVTLAEQAARVVKRLEDTDEDCRLSAVELLGKLPPRFLDTPLYTTALQGRLDDDEGCVRMTAVGVLGALPPATVAPLAPRLMACLEDEYWRVRRQAMEVLAALPAELLALHVEAVLLRLQHTDPRVREWAIAAFGKLSAVLEADTAAKVAPRAAAALQPLLEDEDRRCRERAGALCAKIQKASMDDVDGMPSID